MKLYHLVPFACSPKTFVSPFCKHHFLNMMTPMLLTRVSYIKLIGRECLNFAVNIAQHWNPPTTLWTNNIFADDCYHHVETWDVNKDNITNYYHAQLCIHRKLIWGAPCHNMYSDDDISQRSKSWKIANSKDLVLQYSVFSVLGDAVWQWEKNTTTDVVERVGMILCKLSGVNCSAWGRVNGRIDLM